MELREILVCHATSARPTQQNGELIHSCYHFLMKCYFLPTCWSLKKAKVLKICPSFCLILKKSSVWTICVFSYLMHIFNCHSRLGLLLLLCAISCAERYVVQQVPQLSHRSSHQRFWSGHRHLPSPGQLPHRCQYVSTSHGSSLMSVRCMGVHWCQYIAWEFIDVSTLHGSSLMSVHCMGVHRCWYIAWGFIDVGTLHGGSLMLVHCMGVHRCQYIAWEFIDVSTLHGSSLIIWCQYKPWETAVGYYTEICFATA